MPRVDYKKFNFDLDLELGQKGEDYVLKVFESGNKIEVKTECNAWQRTGNIAIEISHTGKNSGITTTDAETWVQVLMKDDKVVGSIVLPVDYLKKQIKKLVRSKKARIFKTNKKDGYSDFVLVPIKELWS